MGGISVLFLAGFGLAVFAIFAAAVVMFIAGVVIAIFFVCRSRARRARGKKLGRRILIPAMLIAVSAPVLIWMVIALFIPAYESSTDTSYTACAQKVTTHDPHGLKALLENRANESEYSARTYRDLVRLSITYEDEKCLETVLDAAKKNDSPVDLNQPLVPYGEEEGSNDASYALIMAVSSDYRSPETIRILIENGADPKIADDNGETPLHLVCAGLCADTETGQGLEALGETYVVARMLLDAGANAEAPDASGRTPWDRCEETVEDLVERGVLHEDDRAEALAGFSAMLGRS